MCVVSMVTSHYQGQWPNFDRHLHGYTIPPVNEYINFQELVRKAKLYDELTKQKDCIDPKKEEWLKDLEKVMLDNYGIKPLHKE